MSDYIHKLKRNSKFGSVLIHFIIISLLTSKQTFKENTRTFREN